MYNGAQLIIIVFDYKVVNRSSISCKFQDEHFLILSLNTGWHHQNIKTRINASTRRIGRDITINTNNTCGGDRDHIGIEKQ